MQMKRLVPVVVSALLVLAGALPASAAAIVYSNEAAFVAAAGATLHPLPVGPTGGYLQGTSITTTDGVLTLSQAGNLSLFSNWEAYPGVGVSRLAGPDLAISGFEDLNVAINLLGDRFAFGFGIYEPMGDNTIQGCNAICVESTFTITLLKNGATVGSFLLSPANNVAMFWGVHTNVAFNRVQVRETTGGIDNEIFGTFYTGVRAVPEPATLLLLGAGLAAAGVRRRRARA
jgi:hypothetical protein